MRGAGRGSAHVAPVFEGVTRMGGWMRARRGQVGERGAGIRAGPRVLFAGCCSSGRRESLVFLVVLKPGALGCCRVLRVEAFMLSAEDWGADGKGGASFLCEQEEESRSVWKRPLFSRMMSAAEALSMV